MRSGRRGRRRRARAGRGSRPQHHRAAGITVGVRTLEREEIGVAVIGAAEEQLDIGHGDVGRALQERHHAGRQRGGDAGARRNAPWRERRTIRSSRIALCSGPGSVRLIGDLAEMWSCRLRPTPRSATLTAMPCARSSSGSPIPDSISKLRRVDDAAGKITSRSACAVTRLAVLAGIRRRPRACRRGRAASSAPRTRP